tara:strand:- start:32969 stop:33562 length:594 start_codon:yes stop_codon:yes gene_type:complete
MISGTITGRKTFLALTIESRRLDATIRDSIRDLSREFEAKLKAELRRPKGGQAYGVNKGRRSYSKRRVTETVLGKSMTFTKIVGTTKVVRAGRASRPGEAPGVYTGNMVRSIRVKYPAQGKGYSARIFANRKTAFYRHFLEFGTKNRVQKRSRGNTVNKSVGRIAPRPVFTPMQADLQARLFGRVERAVDLFTAFRG